MKLMFMAAMLFAGQCGASGTSSLPPVKLETDGGMTGRGLGNISIDAGKVQASDVRHSCSGTVTDAETKSLLALLETSHPETWKESYASGDRPHGAPDQIHYVLTAAGHSTSWFGEEPESLPADLKKIRAALWSVHDRVVKECP